MITRRSSRDGPRTRSHPTKGKEGDRKSGSRLLHLLRLRREGHEQSPVGQPLTYRQDAAGSATPDATGGCTVPCARTRVSHARLLPVRIYPGGSFGAFWLQRVEDEPLKGEPSRGSEAAFLGSLRVHKNGPGALVLD